MRAQHPEKPRDDETLQDAIDQRRKDQRRKDQRRRDQHEGIEKARKFRERYYPAYTKHYDDISERQAKGETVGQDELDRLWKMHNRLEELKREIAAAADTGEA